MYTYTLIGLFCTPNRHDSPPVKLGAVNGGRMLSGSYSYASNNFTTFKCIKFYGILKSKSSLMKFDKYANLKYKYENRHFWCRGYYVDTVGR